MAKIARLKTIILFLKLKHFSPLNLKLYFAGSFINDLIKHEEVITFFQPDL
jgi:hypothetical protein